MSRKLLLVTHYYAAHGGGVEKVAAELARRLARDFAWEVTWLASGVDLPPDSDPVRIVPMRAWNGLERWLGIPWPVWSPAALVRLWSAVGRADAIHLHDALYFGNAMTWLFARLRRKPVLVTQHVGSIPYRSRVVRSIHALANRSLGRLVLSTANRAVFISPAVQQEFSAFCRFRRTPAYLANGVDTRIFGPSGPLPDEPAIAAARRRGRHVYLFVGRFVEKKGLPILRELAGMRADDLWIFAGHGGIDPEDWGLANVLVVRGQSGAGLAPYFRAADLLVLPSVGEGFPLVVQEAMSCGTPAMVGRETAAGCPDAASLLIIEDVGDPSPADTAARWASRLDRLDADSAALPELRPKVARFARERWSWEATSAAYAGLLESMHSGSAP